MYLINDSTARAQAILEWDGALYLLLGSNFHFMKSLLGFVIPNSWEDMEDRLVLEAASHARLRLALPLKGFKGVKMEQLESQKAIRILQCYIAQLLKFKDEQRERYMEDVFTFMHDSMLPY